MLAKKNVFLFSVVGLVVLAGDLRANGCSAEFGYPITLSKESKLTNPEWKKNLETWRSRQHPEVNPSPRPQGPVWQSWWDVKISSREKTQKIGPFEDQFRAGTYESDYYVQKGFGRAPSCLGFRENHMSTSYFLGIRLLG